jgi:hypothetical protein
MPGEAAVVVSVVHIAKGSLHGPYRLDGREVPTITAFLFHDGCDDDPKPLQVNANKSFQGSIVLGMGFTFDDTDKKSVANPISLMHELIKKDLRNAERIFAYIGGEEVNDSPTHSHHRYVINFEDFPRARDLSLPNWADCDERQRREMLRNGVVPADYPEAAAADWSDLLEIVQQKVKPERDQDNREVRRRYWWKFGERAPALYSAIEPLERVLATSQTSTFRGFAFLSARMVFSHKLVVFPLESFLYLCVLQSRSHDV